MDETDAPASVLKNGSSSTVDSNARTVKTILHKNDTVEIEKCLETQCCGGLFHCPYCDSSVFKPARATKTIDHIQLSHFPHAVYYKDLIILKCFKSCCTVGHYHCPLCSKEILKRINFKDHLLSHVKKDKEDVEHVQTPNCRQPKKIKFSAEGNDINLCELPCEDAVGKHYHCPICKIRNFIDLSSTLTHVWRCANGPKDLKLRGRKRLLQTVSDQLTHPASADMIKYHMSIVRSPADLPVVRCEKGNCCERKFHCPLCPAEKFKPNFQNHLLEHYNVHWKNRVVVNGYAALICYSSCLTSNRDGTTRYHFHCPFCGLTRRQRMAMEVHVHGCNRRGMVNRTQTEPPVVTTDGQTSTAVSSHSESVTDVKEIIENKTESTPTIYNHVQEEEETVKEKEIEDNTQPATSIASNSLGTSHPEENNLENHLNENDASLFSSNSIEDIKLFGTLFGLIPESVLKLLGSSHNLVDDCLTDIARASCTTLRWFSSQDKNLAALEGDLVSLDKAQQLFGMRIKEKLQEVKYCDVNVLHHPETLNDNQTFLNIIQDFLNTAKQSKTLGRRNVKNTGKRGRPKKEKQNQFKDHLKVKQPKTSAHTPFIAEQCSNRRYNTRGKRVKVYNTKDADIDDSEDDNSDSMHDIQLPTNISNNKKYNEDGVSMLEDSNDDSDYIAENVEIEVGQSEDDEIFSKEDTIPTFSVSTMTYLSEEEQEHEKEGRKDVDYTKNWKYSTMFIPLVKVKQPLLPPVRNSTTANKCSFCDFTSEEFWVLNDHMTTNHSDSVTLSCQVCEKYFPKEFDLLKHVEVSHGRHVEKVELSCDYCNKTYKNSKLLAWHLSYTHKLSSINLLCKKCDYQAKSLLDLRKHRLSHRGAKNCEQCGKRFKYYCHLQTHLDTVHRKSVKHICEYCKKVFHHAKYLKSHMKRHIGDKDHVCSICDAAFYESNSLKSHMETHMDSKDRKYRFICSYCGSKYNNKTNFEEHLNKHTGNKPHKCSQCEKSFGYKTMLNQHIRFTHNNERPFQCELCPKSFKVRVRLNQHMTTHTGLSNHTCSSCNKCFTCSTTLKKHLLKCKWANRLMSEEEQLDLTNVEYVEIPREANGEMQAIILDSTSSDNVETVYFSELDLEQVVTEEVTDVTEVVPPSEEEMFVCSECNMAFHSLKQAQEHIVSSHT